MSSNTIGSSPISGGKNGNQAVNPRPATRLESKKTGIAPINEDKEEIRDENTGRLYLEKRLYLCPAGQPVTPVSLTHCLHQISAMQGITKPIRNAIRATAFLLEELEDYTTAENVREIVNAQLSNLSEDMQLLTTDLKEKVDSHLEGKLTDLDKSMDRLNRVIGKLEKAGEVVTNTNLGNNTRQTGTAPGHRTYAETIAAPPPHANPRLAAKEGIRARQLMLEGVNDNLKFKEMDDTKLKENLNKIANDLGLEGRCIRTATKQRLGGLLIEMADDHAARWLKDETNARSFCSKIGTATTFRKRLYNLIAYNVPIIMEPENGNHIKEIHEVNQLEPETIKTARWVKPIARRSPTQKSAHLILSFTDVNAANRALANGLTICHRRTTVEKIRKEPVRCLKCQQWNHYAKECIADHDTCGNCAERHRTNQCPDHTRRKCASCSSADHASWSRECPTFKRKVDECNKRNPENSLPFIPSDEPWTWTTGVNEGRHQMHQERGPASRREINPTAYTHRMDPPLSWDREMESEDQNARSKETTWENTRAGSNQDDFYV